jgi:hypothetical protein
MSENFNMHLVVIGFSECYNLVDMFKSILVCKFLGIVFMANVQPMELFMPRKLLDSEEAAW